MLSPSFKLDKLTGGISLKNDRFTDSLRASLSAWLRYTTARLQSLPLISPSNDKPQQFVLLSLLQTALSLQNHPQIYIGAPVLKALFLDMDETLCDTHKANTIGKQRLADSARALCGETVDGEQFAERYVQGIYRQWNTAQQQRYMPIIEQQGEDAFRVQLIHDLLEDQQQQQQTTEAAHSLRDCFESERLAAFDFFPGIEQFLSKMRKRFKLVVITNGPEFSQVPKVERVQLASHVDHIIIGGQEPEQKPARSIFEKALQLAACESHEVIHIGDGLTPDISGANACNIKSVWVRHNQAFDQTQGITPDYIIEHPAELPGLFQKLL